ncbi:MAG: HepT-like ribonuclease domain-containing protein [Fulvivirga sp.]|nr:HepT-like ribonuclease domain-containing protein [Fulvivirga sp.]
MEKEVQQQHLHNIIRGIEEIKEETTRLTYNDFRKEEQVKESVYANLQMIGEAAYELAQASDDPEDLNFNTDILKGFRNARYNTVAEVDHQNVWNIIQGELDLIHDEALRSSAALNRPAE